MSEDPEATLRRANEAQYILNHALVIEAFATLHASYLRAWEKSPIGDKAKREEIYLLNAGLHNFRAHLTQFLTSGKLVAEEQRSAAFAEEMRGSDGRTVPTATRPENRYAGNFQPV